MAINPNTNATMAGRITAADANYPYASSKDETSPGAGDGTPYFKARADDIFGFQQALLKAASIVPSGNADTAILSEYMQSLVEIASGRAINYNESGIADVYEFDLQANQQGPQSLFDGLIANAIVVNANTGACTVDVAGLGAKSIKTSAGVDPAAGDIPAGGYIKLRFDLINDWWVLESAVIADASTTVKGIVELATDAEVAAGTDAVRAIVPSALAALFGASSQATSGYARIPIKIGGAIDEIIIQWGDGSFTSGTDAVVFPLTFPTAVFQVAAIHGSSPAAGTGTYAVGTQSATLTTSGVTLNASNAATSGTYRYIAIGH